MSDDRLSDKALAALDAARKGHRVGDGYLVNRLDALEARIAELEEWQRRVCDQLI